MEGSLILLFFPFGSTAPILPVLPAYSMPYITLHLQIHTLVCLSYSLKPKLTNASSLRSFQVANYIRRISSFI